MVRFRWFYDTDKETEWLNRMAQQGWAMTDYFLGFYRFAECEPGEYIYQTDMTEKMFGVPEDYRQFMDEMGAEIVCHWGFYVILRRKASEGPFRLYTDVESRIGYYSKLQNLFGTAATMQAAGLLSGIFSAVVYDNPFGWVLALIAGILLLPFLWQSAHLKNILKEMKNRREQTVLEPGENARSHVLAKRGVIVASLFGAPVLYAALHELGHCIAVWLCGGTVTGYYLFDISPHMTYEGVMPRFSEGLIDIFGSVIPLVAAVAVLLLWRGSKKHPLLNICAGIVSGIFLLSTLAWVMEPIGRLMNRIDYSTDVQRFIDTTGLHPAVVMLCALLILGLTCLLFIKRRERFSLGFVDRKFAVRFLAFLITTTFVVSLFSYMGSADVILADGNLKFTAPGNKNSILQEEYDIVVTEPGEYVCYVEYEVNRQGAVGGMILMSEDEIYLNCTANWGKIEFHPIYLESGSYTLRFYLLSCEEDWLEFCEITGEDINGLSDYSWEPDIPATVTGKYRIHIVSGETGKS